MRPERGQFCPKCGYQISDINAHFCDKCGTGLPEKISEIKSTVCLHCGAEIIDKGSQFCNRCGSQLSLAIPAESRCAPIPEVPPKKDDRVFSSKEELVRAKFEETEKVLKTLKDTGTINVVDDYIEKYYKFNHNHLRGTREFNNLKKLLHTKNFSFDDNGLEVLIYCRDSERTYFKFKTVVLQNNPKNAKECIRSFLEHFKNTAWYNDNSNIQMVLCEEFGYKGDTDEDIERMNKEIAREKENLQKKYPDHGTVITNSGTQYCPECLPLVPNPVSHKSYIQEYQRTCKKCSHVWHSLVEREKTIQKGISDDKGFCVSYVCCSLLSKDRRDYGSVITQTKRNTDAQKITLANLRSCPNCGSFDYGEEILSYEKE